MYNCCLVEFKWANLRATEVGHVGARTQQFAEVFDQAADIRTAANFAGEFYVGIFVTG